MTRIAHPFTRREPPLALVIDAHPAALQGLHVNSVRVEQVPSIAAIFERPYRPLPDLIIVMNDLPDGTWLAAVLASFARWPAATVSLPGSGKRQLALTRREVEVLGCLRSANGANAELTAEELCPRPNGVQSVISRLKNRLGYRRAELVLFAYSLGLFAAQAAEQDEGERDA